MTRSFPLASLLSLLAGALILIDLDVLEIIVPLYLILNGVIGLAGRGA